MALVIGNSAYQHTRALPNPRNDAGAIARLLRTNGFAEVTLKSDLDYRAMREAVRLFGETARDADVAVVYYAGHGLEVAGENYLVPIDAKLLRDVDLDYEAVTLTLILNAVDGARRLKLVVLDACRNDPLAGKMALRVGKTRSVTRGLARLEPTGEVLVAFAAKAGTLAQDGTGGHSPYAEALLKHMATPGLDVLRMFGRVKEAVLEATNRDQEPWLYGSPGGEVIALVPATAAPVVPPAPASTAGEAERAWAAAKDSTSIPALEAFIHRFGDTFYSDLAKVRIAELKQSEAAKRKADEEAHAKAEADRRRLALLEEERQRAAAKARQVPPFGTPGAVFAVGRWRIVVHGADQESIFLWTNNGNKAIELRAASNGWWRLRQGATEKVVWLSGRSEPQAFGYSDWLPARDTAFPISNVTYRHRSDRYSDVTTVSVFDNQIRIALPGGAEIRLDSRDADIVFKNADGGTITF